MSLEIKSRGKGVSKYSGTKSRIVKDVDPPPSHKLSMEEAYSQKTNKPNLGILKAHFIKEGRLKTAVVARIVKEATEILRRENTLLSLETHISVCGDIHGQFYDLLTLFNTGGNPESTNYLFLGDYVDRGHFSTEVVLFLFGNKINYPKTFFLLRGNHESRKLTTFFNFKRECLVKYNIDIYNLFMEAFDALPLAAVMDNKFLCLHGGISPECYYLSDINRIDRFREPPSHGAMCDLLWSDPSPDYNKDETQLFSYNKQRGCSYYYHYKAVVNFLRDNSLLCVIRAHEVYAPGFNKYKPTPANFPSLITIFSAPNYCDIFRNKGVVLYYETSVMSFRNFKHAPHPYWLPNFLDAFNWSLPYVAEKITRILVVFLQICLADETDPKLLAKLNQIKKIMNRYARIREESDNILNMTDVPSNVTLPMRP